MSITTALKDILMGAGITPTGQSATELLAQLSGVMELINESLTALRDEIASDRAAIFNNDGKPHTTNTDFNNLSSTYGTHFVGNGAGTTPVTNGPTSSQYYGFTLGLGTPYEPSDYSSQLYWPRTGSPYLNVRFRENGSFSAWSKIYAGYADRVPVSGVTGILASSQGGTGVNNGANTLTVPATGTAALLNEVQTFSKTNTFSANLNVGGAMSIAGKTALHAGNTDSVLSAGGDAAPGANKLVRTQANGYTFLYYINSTSPVAENGSISQVITTTSYDNYYRKSSIEQLTAAIIAGQSAWTAMTLSAGWSNVSIYEAPATYWKDSVGVVHLRGHINWTAGANSSFAILPYGYTPDTTHAFPMINSVNNAGQLIVAPDGRLIINLTTAAAGWAIIDGITFRPR